MIAPFNPGSVVMLTMGIFLLGALPPVGVMLIIGAVVSARRYRAERRMVNEAAYAKAMAKRLAQRDAAALRLAR